MCASLELAKDLDAPAQARAAIAGFCADRGIDPTTLATLTLLVSEIVTTSNPPDVDKPTTIGFYARVAPRLVAVKVTDQAGGLHQSPPTLLKSAEATRSTCSTRPHRVGMSRHATKPPSGSS